MLYFPTTAIHILVCYLLLVLVCKIEIPSLLLEKRKMPCQNLFCKTPFKMSKLNLFRAESLCLALSGNDLEIS